MTFAQRRNLLTTHFSERITVVKRRTTVHTTVLTFRFCFLHTESMTHC